MKLKGKVVDFKGGKYVETPAGFHAVSDDMEVGMDVLVTLKVESITTYEELDVEAFIMFFIADNKEANPWLLMRAAYDAGITYDVALPVLEHLLKVGTVVADDAWEVLTLAEGWEAIAGMRMSDSGGRTLRFKR